MRDIRIWCEDNKRCEAVWLSHLLTLCGYQVWIGRLSEADRKYKRMADQNQYVDILLFRLIDRRICNYFINYDTGRGIWVCGLAKAEIEDFLQDPFVWGVSKQLDTRSPESLKSLMGILSGTITVNPNEKAAILRLTDLFIERNNELSKCIYTIQEMFCSRKIDYARYRNVGILLDAISDVETWLDGYVEKLVDKLTYVEMFAIIYLQNLINEGYIKARKTGGYDAKVMLRNANYLLRSEAEAEAVRFLKLQILHNCISFTERPDDILNLIKVWSKPEYISRAFCEVGDIYREEKNKSSDLEVSDYYENADYHDIENYRGLYRAGLVYEEKGNFNFIWYQDARKKYEMVINLISGIKMGERTPQEFEYFYKAYYRRIKMSISFDCSNGSMTYEREERYCKELKDLISECKKIEEVVFLKKLYGEGNTFLRAKNLMKEKMEEVKAWAKNLIVELENK